jgi:hypothetical protein
MINFATNNIMIVAFLGESVKEYQAKYQQLLAELKFTCPICNHKCHNHGWYKRKTCNGDEVITIKLLRLKCTNCSRTHAVIPDFLRPKARYLQQIREKAVTACHLMKVPIEKATINGQAAETTRRWLKQFKDKLVTVVSAIRSILARYGQYDTIPKNESYCQIVSMSRKLVAILGGIPERSSLFGLINIFLSTHGLQIWI